MKECRDIFTAAADGDIDEVRKLLEKGISVNQCDEEGYTPLHWAVQEGHLSVVKLLIE